MCGLGSHHMWSNMFMYYDCRCTMGFEPPNYATSGTMLSIFSSKSLSSERPWLGYLYSQYITERLLLGGVQQWISLVYIWIISLT